MPEIALSRGFVALVDSDDLPLVCQYQWHVACRKSTHSTRHYAEATPRYRHNILMHRLIMGAQRGDEIDHVNGNPLDNRRCNLRFCTRSQNNANQRKTRGSSRFKGVCFDKQTGKWRAQISYHGKRIKVGRFVTEEAAALAYQSIARELFPEFGTRNDAGSGSLLTGTGLLTPLGRSYR
jgi:hypothetical protein